MIGNSKCKMQNANNTHCHRGVRSVAPHTPRLRSIQRLHFAFCILNCASIFLLSGCSRSLDFERMREQKRTDAYAASMRTPPAGTVAVSDRTVSVTDVSVERGRHVYDIYCAVCHSEDSSAPTVMASNMPGTPPPALTTGEAAQRSAAEMFEVVSRGKNRMPAYDWALPTEDRWAVVAYVKMR